jgi:hypothetical protein
MSKVEYYSISEASRYTNKSEMTIRRLVKKVYDDYRVSGEIKLTKQQNGSTQYLINKVLLDKFFNHTTPIVPIQNNGSDIQSDYTPDSQPPIQLTQEKFESFYNKQIEDVRADIQIFKDQLFEKDKQIDKLMNELSESRNQSNTLLINIQNNLVPLIENQQKMLQSYEKPTKRKKFLGIF